MDTLELIKQAKEQFDLMSAKYQQLGDFDWLPDLPKHDKPHIGPNLTLIIPVPYTRAAWEAWQDYFKTRGWEIQCVWDEKTCLENKDMPMDPSFHAVKDGRQVYVSFNTWAEGATCKRQIVGHRTVSEPVYEFACSPAFETSDDKADDKEGAK